MSLRSACGFAAIVLATALSMSCGQVYRPVVIPVSITPPNPANFHTVFAISTNVPANQGTALQIDVSGDSDIGVANVGMNPTHAAILSTNARFFVASAGSLYTGDADVITAYTPASGGALAAGLSNLTTFTLPNFGPANPSTGLPEWSCSYLPDFLSTVQNGPVYVANYGVDNAASCAPNLSSTDSVAMLDPTTDTIPNIAYLPPGAHPVAIAETPNAENLYVVNQGNGTVADLSPIDLSTLATIPVGNIPVWAVARADNQRVYVLTEGDGKLVPIDTRTNTVLPSRTNLSVGAGANFLLYDPNLNRLYVTNPSTGTVYVFSAIGGMDLSGNANDTPTLLATISMTAGPGAPCKSACSPVSVTALPDGSRFYVASYEEQAACSDPNVGSSIACIIPMLTVFDAPSMTVKPVSSTLLAPAPSLSLLTSPPFASTQYAVRSVASCAPSVTYAPGSTRFRMFTAAAADGSHVYVSICDAGAIADIFTTTNTISTAKNNTPDTLVTDIVAPFSASVAGSNNEPPPQNPIFLLTGQ